MGMTIDEALSHLNTYSSTMGSGQTTQEQHEDAKRVAIDTMRKYQLLQADYEARLKADMVAMLEELKEQLKEMHEDYFETDHVDEAYGVSVSMDVIQQKIDKLKEVEK